MFPTCSQLGSQPVPNLTDCVFNLFPTFPTDWRTLPIGARVCTYRNYIEVVGNVGNIGNIAEGVR